MAKLKYARFNYINCIGLTKKDYLNCSKSGNVENEAKEVVKKRYIQNRFKNIDSTQLAKELKEYGAWNSEELKDNEANKERIIWIASCDIKENI